MSIKPVHTRNNTQPTLMERIQKASMSMSQNKAKQQQYSRDGSKSNSKIIKLSKHAHNVSNPTMMLPSSANVSKSDVSITFGSKKQSPLGSRLSLLKEKEKSLLSHKRNNTSFTPIVQCASVVPSPIREQSSVLKIKPGKSKIALKMNKLLKRICKNNQKRALLKTGENSFSRRNTSFQLKSTITDKSKKDIVNKTHLRKKKVIKLSIKKSFKEAFKDAQMPNSSTNYSTSIKSDFTKRQNETRVQMQLQQSSERKGYSPIDEMTINKEESPDEVLSEIEHNSPRYTPLRHYDSSAQNTRYFTTKTAWDDDDKKLDDELESKKRQLLIHDFYGHHNNDQQLKRNDSSAKKKSRESFDIEIRPRKRSSSEERKSSREERKSLLELDNESHDSSHISPIHELISPCVNNKINSRNDESDLVCVDPSMEERLKSLRRSKSRIDKFKELVNESKSKHLSVMMSNNVCETESEYGSDNDVITVMLSESFNDMSHLFKPKSKPKGEKLDEAQEFVEVVKDKLNIDEEQQSCLLLPKLKIANNYGIRPAVYDFIYMTPSAKEPQLEFFKNI